MGVDWVTADRVELTIKHLLESNNITNKIASPAPGHEAALETMVGEKARITSVDPLLKFGMHLFLSSP